MDVAEPETYYEQKWLWTKQRHSSHRSKRYGKVAIRYIEKPVASSHADDVHLL